MEEREAEGCRQREKEEEREERTGPHLVALEEGVSLDNGEGEVAEEVLEKAGTRSLEERRGNWRPPRYPSRAIPLSELYVGQGTQIGG